VNFPYLRSNRRGVAACFAIVLAVCSCDEARRIPRIEPVLHLWKSPYVGFDGLQIHVFDTGVVRAPAALYQRGGSWFDMREVPVPAFVVEHPDKGLVVFDTGLSARVASDTVPYLGLLAPLDVVRANSASDIGGLPVPQGGQFGVLNSGIPARFHVYRVEFRLSVSN